jgi:protein TonB
LDKSAMEAAMRWRYVPGKRGGVAETMWYQVPIQFTLE